MAAWATASVVAAVPHPIVINEILVTPAGTAPKFVELYNRGPLPVSLGSWWICDQPSAVYRRLLQTPSAGGPSASPPIILAPGDYLLIFWRLPGGAYSAAPNGSGTITHFVNIGVPANIGLTATAGNFSIWDQVTPETPTFDAPTLIRDFVAWGVNGVYVGSRRGCVAADPAAMLWPPPIFGNCFQLPDEVQFVAVNSQLFPVGSGRSINYRGTEQNDPTDYFVAPASPGERNAMPGDLDGDLDMDGQDAAIFDSCLNHAPKTPECQPADLNGDRFVDCEDWLLFVAHWRMYAEEPLPPTPKPCQPICTPGDTNGDGAVNGLDIRGFVHGFTGQENNPVELCASDVNNNGQLDCDDIRLFTQIVLGGPVSCLPGDANADGAVDGLDVSAFIAILLGQTCPSALRFCAADADASGEIDMADVPPFVSRLVEP